MTFVSLAQVFHELISYVIREPLLHAKWLNTLSYLENCGAKKIAACQHPTLVREEVLKHAAEEFRHAHYLKSQIKRVSIDCMETYGISYILGGMDTLHYLHALQTEHHPLYLYAFSTLYAPTRRSLAGQLSHRLGLNHALESQEGGEWSIPLSKERLQACAPSWVVFSLRDPQVNSESISQHTLLQGTPAAINNQIFVVDEAFQDSPTHFLLLAYYDLVALIHPQLSDGAPY